MEESSSHQPRLKCDINYVKAHVKRKIPILEWMPTYQRTWFIQDVIAGITVGLTSIPQSMSAAIIAGLSPEYGLYASFMGSFVYILFGSCDVVSVGPPLVLALLIQPVASNYGADTIVLMCFLNGCITILLGIFNLGFLFEFISNPAITGILAGGSVIIASTQIHSLLGIPDKQKNVISTIKSIYKNYNKINSWDLALGISTILGLIFLKNIPGKRTGSSLLKIGWIIILARNVLAVVFGMSLVYVFGIYEMEPFHLTGKIGHGVPPFTPPPFSTNFNNHTYNFIEMTRNMGWTLYTIPIISIIIHVTMAKGFVGGKSIDTSQEIISIGACSIFSSFVRSMPVTGSLTRTAINRNSGVKTPLAGLFSGAVVLLICGLCSSTFRLIPRATLAGVIICAMLYMLDFHTYRLIWQARKLDFLVMIVSMAACVLTSMEEGIAVAIVIDIIILLLTVTTRSSTKITVEETSECTVICVALEEPLPFPAVDNLRANIMKVFEERASNVILDCKNLKRINVTVAQHIKQLASDISARDHELIFINASAKVKHVLNTIVPQLSNKFKEPENSNRPYISTFSIINSI